MKLLIAEDSLTSRTMLAAVTEKWGYETVVTEDGEEAWEVMQQDDAPGLLLIDWEMPRLDGPGLCQRIRQQETNNPPFIILLTGRTGSEDTVKGLESGANDYVTKPFDRAELQARLEVGQRMLKLQDELIKTQEILSYQANHDVLTGLKNRRALMDVLKAEIARAQRQRQTLCIGMCDIDHFKQINDTHGHLAGDVALQEIATRMKSTLRPYDHVGRSGGEEFLIILTPESNQLLGPFERVRIAIAEKPIIVDSASINITISCGVTRLTPDAAVQDIDTLIGQADTALYQAKDKGRNQTILFDPSPKYLQVSGE